MSDLKDRLKEGLSEVAERGRRAGTRAADLAGKAGKSAAGTASDMGAKAVGLAQDGAAQALDAGQSLYTRLRGEEQAQLKDLGEGGTLSELSEDQQDEYLYALLPALVPFDPPDVDRLRRVFQILTVMDLGKRRRWAFLEELFVANSCPEGIQASALDEATRISLGKDVLILSARKPTDDSEQRVAGLLQSLRLSQDQVEVLNHWTAWENRMLEKFGSSDFAVDQTDMPLEAMKKAGAIGVPLTALYASGSVVGFGAAGITSGLATIGGTTGLTALGLNPMTAGIAALVLLGVGVKKLLDAKLPTARGDKRKKLEAAARAMQARRSRYLAILSQDFVHLRRNVPQDLSPEGKRCWQQAVEALEDLLEAEAETTLGEGIST